MRYNITFLVIFVKVLLQKETNPLSHRCAMPAPPKGELIALPQALRLSRKLYRYARGSLPEGAGKAVRLCLRELSSRFPRKKHRFPVRKAVLFSTFFCPVVEHPVQF